MTNSPESPDDTPESFSAEYAAERLDLGLSLAEQSALTPPTVVPGHGYPADRVETSPEPTGWQASGSSNPGSAGKLTEVSRETF